MKNLIFAVALVVMSFFGPFAEAQQIPIPEVSGPGRPDPTGRGRYLQYGTEVAYSGATVLKELPAGVKCAPAGELVGVPVWNTTRRDHVIASVLTDKAEVATSGNRTFLCWCVAGFNELFLPDVPAETFAEPITQAVVKEETKIVHEVRILGGMDLRIVPPPSAFEPPPVPLVVKGKSHKTRNLLIGLGTAVVLGVVGKVVYDYYYCPPGTFRQ